MSCTIDFLEYVKDQISKTGHVAYKKMFGEAMIYVNNFPILLVCDDIVYVKKIEELSVILKDAALGIPYPKAKEHYILDIDDYELAEKVVDISIAYRISHAKKTKKNKIVF
jgi:TfoX/Sxy family transcriptional regulator of competence genes